MLVDMKVVYFCVFVVFSCALALPPPLDWDNIRENIIKVDALNTAPVTPSERVIGGTEVVPNSIPFQVALIINNASFCGGSLISRDWILTAAHCTTGATIIIVKLGAHNNRRPEPSQVFVTTSNFINHPLYSRPNLINDIALVRLPYSVPLTSAIQLVKLAPENSGTFEGSKARLTGWGTTSDSTSDVSPILRAVKVDVISNIRCQQMYGTIFVQKSSICTYGGSFHGACHGDSGGPLTVNDVQVGVVSFVSNLGCQSGTPTVYTRVSSFRKWITAHTGV